jgi:hypothetical protein
MTGIVHRFIRCGRFRLLRFGRKTKLPPSTTFRRCRNEGAAGALVAAVGPAAAGAQLAHLLR